MGKTKARKNDEELFTYAIGRHESDKYFKSSEAALESAAWNLKIKNVAPEIWKAGEVFVYITEIEQLYGPPIDVEKVIDELQIAYCDTMDSDYENWLGDLTELEKKALGEKLNGAFREWLDQYGRKPCAYRDKSQKIYKYKYGRTSAQDVLLEV